MIIFSSKKTKIFFEFRVLSRNNSENENGEKNSRQFWFGFDIQLWNQRTSLEFILIEMIR